jgi:hypothetical protein
MSKIYQVSVPITGIAFIQVAADSEEEAIEAAIGEITIDNIEEWSGHEHIVAGNIFYGMQNEAEAIEESEEPHA